MSEEPQPPTDGDRANHQLTQLGEGWRRVQLGDMIVYETPVAPDYFTKIAERQRTYNRRPLWWRILRKLGIIKTELA